MPKRSIQNKHIILTTRRFILPLIIALFTFAISRLNCEVRRYQRAAEKYERILRHDPTNIKASLRCGYSYYQQAMREKTESRMIEFFDKAIECYRRAMALDKKKDLFLQSITII